ncbi:MAG: hypothetical protein ACOWWO_03450 [Peptococcaceae bacterium]
MEELLTCPNCGGTDFMPVIRMRQGGSHSLSSPITNWAGARCCNCNSLYDDVYIAPYLATKHFK